MEKLKLTVKDSSLTFFVSFLLCQLGIIIFAFVGLVVCSFLNINIETFESFTTTVWGYLISSLITNIVLIAIFLKNNKKKEINIIKKPKITKILLYSLIAVGSFFCLTPTINSINILLAKIGYPITNFPYTLTTSNYFISLISLVILPAICEELIFRGIIFKGLRSSGKNFAIITSSIMFSLYHMSAEQTIYPLLIGLMLGVIMCNENNILYCIIVHFINNFLSLTTAYFGISLFFNHWSYHLLALALAALFTVALTIFISKTKDNLKQKLENEGKNYLIACLSIMAIIWIIVLISKFIMV